MEMLKEEKDSMVTSWAALALHDGEADVTSEQLKTLIEATGNEGRFEFSRVGVIINRWVGGRCRLRLRLWLYRFKG